MFFSFNNFSGVLPLAYKDLMQSLEVTISHNHITGSVPLTDFDEIQLMSLDLSHNLLTGLPLSNLESISSLRYLDVSNNNLSGLIKQRNKRSSLEFVSYGTILVNCSLSFFLSLLIHSIHLANNKLTGVLPSLFDEKLGK
jgi:Leucine-rich repeat (LRR) protein